MFAFTLLLRNWRSGELKLLSISIVLAVAVLGAISLFTDRLDSTLVGQSNSLLGADNIVAGNQPPNPEWIAQATADNVKNTQTLEFRSMAFAGDEMHLANVKAVDKSYPLRGNLEISVIPFAMNPQDIKTTHDVPSIGEVWVDSRLLSQLKINIGDKLSVGELELTVTQALIREPESASPFSALAPRILMNVKDIPATNIIQLGSDIKYDWLLAADNSITLEKFIQWLKPQLNKHQKIQDIASSQERLGNTLSAGKNFLILAAVIAVLLAGVAIAIAARQFSERHTSQVALLKSLGAGATKIRMLYINQLFILGCLASLVGLAAGFSIQEIVAVGLKNNFQLVLHNAHWQPYILSFISGLVCLAFFALPALWFLPAIPPLKILRRELINNSINIRWQFSLAFLAIMILVYLFSGDWILTLSISGTLFLVAIASLLLSILLLALLRKTAVNSRGFWRMAFANLQRRRGQSLIQIMVFAIAILLLVTLTIIKTSLIDDWKKQLPQNAANHFITNIPPAELADVQGLLDENHIVKAPLYPMVRGRLIEINDAAPAEEMVNKTNALQRELNLTWTAELAADNKILQGSWWDTWKKHELPGVSVENETAKNMHLKIGDTLLFSLGGLNQKVEVASIRSVDWRSLKPNFFFIFEPGSMESFSPTFMTSIYLAPEQKGLVNQLLRKHPTVLVLEFDRIIQQMHTIIEQVSNGIQLVLWLTLAAGAMVLFAAVLSSIDSRKQESGLLRALGSPRTLILGSVLVEFIVIGLLAGTVAVFGAEALLFSLQKFVLKTPIQPHFLYWILAPMGSAIFVGALGLICCRSVITTPPLVVLREAQ